MDFQAEENGAQARQAKETRAQTILFYEQKFYELALLPKYPSPGVKVEVALKDVLNGIPLTIDISTPYLLFKELHKHIFCVCPREDYLAELSENERSSLEEFFVPDRGFESETRGTTYRFYLNVKYPKKSKTSRPTNGDQQKEETAVGK